MSALIIQGNASGTGSLTLQSANTSSTTTLTLPATDGTSNQALVTNGSGVLSFASVGTGTVTAVSVASANGLAGTSSGGATPQLTISTSITGVLKGNGTAISAATAGTDYLAPPSGTAILKANSGGALANATAGTDYVAPGTSSVFTAAQTFQAANAIRSEAASTQDAIVIAGRAGGTSSYAVTLTPATLSASRTVTLPDGGANYTLGYINAPQSTNTTVAASDSGKHIYFSGGSTATLTVNTNATTAIDVGTVILVVNDNSGNLTISGAGVTFQLANGATGNRTVATKGMATLLKVATDTWYVSGAGVT